MDQFVGTGITHFDSTDLIDSRFEHIGVKVVRDVLQRSDDTEEALGRRWSGRRNDSIRASNSSGLDKDLHLRRKER
jgi:hypothetical protein